MREPWLNAFVSPLPLPSPQPPHPCHQIHVGVLTLKEVEPLGLIRSEQTLMTGISTT
jgi:hypothetical protein